MSLAAQAAFGRQALALSSFFTYLGLGLGLLGSSLALPYGLYVIICQRAAEQYVQVRGWGGEPWLPIAGLRGTPPCCTAGLGTPTQHPAHSVLWHGVAWPQDSVTPPGETRATVTAVAVLTAILVLLPMAPELADSFGVGPENPFF